ncbi:MAG: hypothetical protein UHX00_01320 [Caryophanon sp.]|nr:hypothetical protein [Caryophanon sp.]
MYTLEEVEFSGLPIEIDKGSYLFLSEVADIFAYELAAYLKVKVEGHNQYVPLYAKRGD